MSECVGLGVHVCMCVCVRKSGYCTGHHLNGGNTQDVCFVPQGNNEELIWLLIHMFMMHNCPVTTKVLEVILIELSENNTLYAI